MNSAAFNVAVLQVLLVAIGRGVQTVKEEGANNVPSQPWCPDYEGASVAD